MYNFYLEIVRSGWTRELIKERILQFKMALNNEGVDFLMLSTAVFELEVLLYVINYIEGRDGTDQ